MIHVAMHGAGKSLMRCNDPFTKHHRVTDEHSMVVGCLWPVGRLHHIGIKAVDTTRVSGYDLANGIMVRK
jgi:hypothetical protein